MHPQRLAALLLVVSPAVLASCAVPTDEGAPSEAVAEVSEALTCVTLKRGGPAAVSDATLDFDPTDPTRAQTNFGAANTLSMGLFGTVQRRAVLQFDLSPIPAGSIVSSATLTVRKALGAGPGPVSLHNIQVPWSEGSVTWNAIGSSFDATALASFAQQPNGPVSIDLTSAVSSWVSGATANHGVLLQQPAQGRTAVGASDANNTALRPALSVCYTAPSCTDGLQNQGEAGVDCGGPCAQACVVVWQGDYVVSDAASAAGLAGIDAITGALYMYHTSGVTTLPPSRLASIGTYLYIDHDTGLTSLSGLSNLQTIGSYLYVDHDHALTTLGLTSLTTVGAYVYITNNPSLTSLGLDSLSDVGGNHNGYGGYVYIDHNTALSSLDLGQLSTIEEYLYLSHSALTTLGLGSLTQATDAWMSSNPLLPACEVTNVQAQITGGQPVACGLPASCSNGVLDGGEQATDCGGPCTPCATCSDGVQSGAETGADCGGSCSACATCSDGAQNQGEDDIDCGFPCAACVTCSDGIQNQGEAAVDCGGPCTACPTCADAIHNQGEVGIDCGGPCSGSCGNVHQGDYHVTDAASAAGLASIDAITGGLYMYHTAGVFSLPSSPLAYAGYIYVDHDDDLTSLSGLANLQGVGGYIYFDNNQSLDTLGLVSLTHVGGYVYVTNNPVLTSLGLDSLTTVVDYAYLGNNPALPACTDPALQAQISGAPPVACP